MTGIDILFIAVMKMVRKRVNFRVVRGIVMPMDQSSFSPLLPVEGILPCFTEPDVEVGLILEMKAQFGRSRGSSMDYPGRSDNVLETSEGH